MVVMSGDVGCWCALFGTLVGVSVLSVKFFHGAPYAVCVELKNVYLFVFCFGGLLFVSCVGVCGCGDVRSWGGDVWKFV